MSEQKQPTQGSGFSEIGMLVLSQTAQYEKTLMLLLAGAQLGIIDRIVGSTTVTFRGDKETGDAVVESQYHFFKGDQEIQLEELQRQLQALVQTEEDKDEIIAKLQAQNKMLQELAKSAISTL